VTTQPETFDQGHYIPMGDGTRAPISDQAWEAALNPPKREDGWHPDWCTRPTCSPRVLPLHECAVHAAELGRAEVAGEAPARPLVVAVEGTAFENSAGELDPPGVTLTGALVDLVGDGGRARRAAVRPRSRGGATSGPLPDLLDVSGREGHIQVVQFLAVRPQDRHANADASPGARVVGLEHYCLDFPQPPGDGDLATS
jgi:hypothetical protein